MTKPPHILIAGGGIGGLTAAIVLSKGGAKVSLFEKASEFGEVGAGLQLSPNSMAVLSALGLSGKIKAAAFAPAQGVLRDYITGKPLLATQMGDAFTARYGQAYYNIHRADLHNILVTAAQDCGVDFHLNHYATNYAQNAKSVTLVTNQGDHIGDALIGADGIKSTIREQMVGGNTPRYTGYCAWRGIIRADAAAKDLLPRAANNWLGPDKHFVAYYLRGGELINFIAVHRRESWSAEGWTTPGDMNELREAYDGWDDRVGAILDVCDETYLWGLFDHPALPNWTDGRVALLGDAAHPMLPFMAQGASMAIEDGWVLAAKLLGADTPIAFKLRAYQAARHTRTTMLQDISRRNADLYHAHDAIGLTKRTIMFKTAKLFPAATHSRLDPIYGVDVTKEYPI